MPSPFPGMNPYLEQETVWHDFHERFCPAAAEMLTAQIRPHFIAKIDEHVYIPFIYGGEPRPPLAADDATWARQWVSP